MTDADVELRALLALLLKHDPEPVALARLGKQLRLPMSVLLRLLAALGPHPVSPAHSAPGWVMLEQRNGRQLAGLSPAGRDAAQAWERRPEPD